VNPQVLSFQSRLYDATPVDGDSQYGDWVSVEPTDDALFATAIFAHSTDLLCRTARVLGKEDDAVRYDKLFGEIVLAFQRRFVSADGSVGNDSQTAKVLALQFNLLPNEMKQLVAKRLMQDVSERTHLTTGFFGTEYLCLALSEFGYTDSAYKLLLREEYPSWLYMIRRGATTIWERWDGIREDGTFQDPGMNSFNHRTLGSIGEWMYHVMAGIESDEANAGYKHSLIQPHPGGDITKVNATHETMYGRVTSDWMIKGDTFEAHSRDTSKYLGNRTAACSKCFPRYGERSRTKSRKRSRECNPGR
jgi:alpha-L-rhamnosidase